ncbi:hypothetical protein AX774_g372 [Zancudomyces culisetae]|uniref:Uncharacterized protein n=1 Tax=Zancudomyces culisetae TaxID=1213189 RepID=A0A1R1PYN8_ZANCU|nr:hypothetical protein AX774_g372 [Zancudomyces culisetae]|eukprot:OMH86057.1 hypothetical protein AX774_g372 [Zancudomyces culisetae]
MMPKPFTKPEFLRQFEPDSFDYIDQSTGFILVNRGLQVIGHSNIFAIGDCNNIKGPKSESRSLSQAQCIGKTIGQWALTHAAKRPYLKVLPETWAADCESALLSIISNEKKEIGLYLSNGFSDTYKLKSYRKFEIDIKKTEGLKNLAKLVGSGIRGSFNN